MSRLLLCFFLLIALPKLVLAGAWQREEGQLFVAANHGLSFNFMTAQKQRETGLYLEYGLRPKLTLGLNLHRKGDTEGHGFAFLRLPLHQGKKGAHLAAEFGIGQKRVNGTQSPLAVVGLSWGRGLTIRDRSGWLALDSAIHFPESNDPVIKFDTTLGLSVSDRAKLLGQLFLESGETNSHATLAPGIAYQIKTLKTDLVLGLRWQTDMPETVGINFGFWRSF